MKMATTTIFPNSSLTFFPPVLSFFHQAAPHSNRHHPSHPSLNFLLFFCSSINLTIA
jgi:hypothetical protein